MPKPSEIFVTPYDSKLYINLNSRPPKIDYKCDVYSISHLAELIEQIRKRGEDTIRYLVDTASVIWFALEGAPGSTVPAHWQMTGEYQSSAKCLAAGNIRFSESYGEITVINHKSGDFRPDFISLQIVLAILAKNRSVLESRSIKLASELSIESLSSSGGYESTFSIKLKDLYSWVDDRFRDRLLTQPDRIKTLVSERTLKRCRSDRDDSDEDCSSDEESSEFRRGPSDDDSKRRKIGGGMLHKLELTGTMTTMPGAKTSDVLPPLALFSTESTEPVDEMDGEPAAAGAGTGGHSSFARSSLLLLSMTAKPQNNPSHETRAEDTPIPVCRALSF